MTGIGSTLTPNEMRAHWHFFFTPHLCCSNRSVEKAFTVRILDRASVANPFATANAEKICDAMM